MSPREINDEQVQLALKVLAEHDRGRESQIPASRIYRLRPVSRWKAGSAYAAFAAAAAMIAVVMLRTSVEPLPVPKPLPNVVTAAEPVPEVAAVAVSIPATAAPVRRAKRVAPVRREVVTEFFSLMDAPPPFERGQLLRVVVPASTMRRVGLPVNPDRWSERIQADVLVGEEGMARAIRFVSYQE